MAGKPLRIVCVGKLRTSFWKEAAAHYSRRIGRWRPLDVTEVRDGDAGLDTAQRNSQEGRRLLEALTPQDVPIVMDERGSALTSREFADLLRKLDLDATGRPCFLVGGPFGLDAAVRAVAR